jgi:hypothetical protein
MAEFPAPREGILVTRFIVSSDVGWAWRFYTDVLDGEVPRQQRDAVTQDASWSAGRYEDPDAV